MDQLVLLADLLLDTVFLPIVSSIDSVLNTIAAPVSDFPLLFQVACFALAASLFSKGLDLLLPGKKPDTTAFQKAMDKRCAVPETGDPGMRAALKNAYNREADQAYETSLNDLFFRFGITHLAPMFTLLIWMDTSRFPKALLQAQNGHPFVYSTGPETGITSGVAFVIFFNLWLFAIWVGIRLTRRLA